MRFSTFLGKPDWAESVLGFSLCNNMMATALIIRTRLPMASQRSITVNLLLVSLRHSGGIVFQHPAAEPQAAGQGFLMNV
jgi:hypothetical protein